MKKFQIVFLFVFLVGCSSSPEALTTLTPVDMQTPSLFPTQTATPPTQILTPMAMFTPTITQTAIGDGAGKIAFTSERDGYREIYTMNADGSDQVKLANNITPKFDPAWSPNGKKLAFGSHNNDSGGIYIMNADGSDPNKIIDIKELNIYDQMNSGRFGIGFPNWSPDGQKIVFSVSYYIGCCRVQVNNYMINLNDNTTNNPAGNDYPVWSLDGQKIAFASSNCGGMWGICVMNSDGPNLINIAHERGYGGSDNDPVWSPDGKKIAFTSGRNGDREVFVMSADGSDQINLTKYGSGWDGGPSWSPDGKKIAFSSYRDGNYEIYVMNSDGSNQINLTNHSANDHSPVWSPDSTKIAFVSERDGDAEIYMVDVDGSNLLRLTNNGEGNYSPVWSP